MSSTGLVSLYVAYIFYLHDMKFVDCCSFCEISRCEKEQKIESDSKFVQDFGGPAKSCYTLGSTNESLAIENRPGFESMYFLIES